MKIDEMDELAWTGITEENFIFTTKVFYLVWTILSLLSALHPVPYGRYLNYVKFNGRLIRAQYVYNMLFFVVLSPILVVYFTPSRMMSNFSNIVAIMMLLNHYFHRSIIYPIKYLANASPLSIQTFVCVVPVAILHGCIQGFYLSNIHRVPDVRVFSFIGLILYVTGLAINISHDRILVQLRITQKQDQGQKSITKNSENGKKYSIPRGGLFEFVSAANYFGEIVEWWGWALFSQGFPQVAFATISTITIGIRGWQHHQFYKRVFGKAYPAKRRAIIPFIL